MFELTRKKRKSRLRSFWRNIAKRSPNFATMSPFSSRSSMRPFKSGRRNFGWEFCVLFSWSAFQSPPSLEMAKTLALARSAEGGDLPQNRWGIPSKRFLGENPRPGQNPIESTWLWDPESQSRLCLWMYQYGTYFWLPSWSGCSKWHVKNMHKHSWTLIDAEGVLGNEFIGKSAMTSQISHHVRTLARAWMTMWWSRGTSVKMPHLLSYFELTCALLQPLLSRTQSNIIWQLFGNFYLINAVELRPNNRQVLKQ